MNPEAPADWINVSLFDGRSTTGRVIEVAVSGGGLRRRVAAGTDHNGDLLALRRVHERYGRAPRRVDLEGGEHLEIPYAPELDAWLDRRETGVGGFASRLERRWRFALASLLVLLIASVGFVVFGIPFAADLTARLIPPEWERVLTQNSIEVLDHTIFAASRLAAEEQTRQQALFAEVRQAMAPELDIRLLVRGGGALGANAFALPSRTVVITDELLGLAAADAEIRAVYAHEIGHVKERHLLRLLLRNSIASVMIFLITSDVSSISGTLAALPVWLTESAYSRRFETEADDLAFRYLRQHGDDPEVLRRLLERLGPATDSGLITYFSTHPPTGERVPASTGTP